MQSRQGLASILAYCKQDKKTLYNGRKLESGVNCVPQSAFNEMMNTKIQYRKTDGRMYYHLFQSFHPDEPITPETAYENALKFAQKQFKGYEVLVATHIDREHIHSHFIVNSVSAETGLKYHPDKNEIQRLRDYSDSADRYAEIDTGRNFRTDYERGNTNIPQPPDEFLAEVYRQFQCNGADLQDGASEYDEQLCESDKRCGEKCLTTGWEHEREVFIQYQSGRGETESLCEDTVFPGFDTDSYYGNNGNDIAYLVADLTNILDSDHPVEDCTTIRKPRKERKNTQKSNPQGGFNMSM